MNKRFPKGWIGVPLSQIAILNPKPKKDSIDFNLEVSFTPMKCVEELTGKIDLTNTKKIEDVKKGFTYYENQDILFAKITPCMENGKIAIAQGLKNGIGYGSTEFHVIRLLSSKIPRQFYFYYLIQDDFRKKARNKMKGTAGQLRVPTSVLTDEVVPLPPLHEQKRIVSKLESIFTQIDACKEKLEALQAKVQSGSASLATLKSSVLKQAFEGKLVPQNSNEEPAEILLKKICKDPEITFDKDNLPKGWIHVKINDVCKTTSGGTPSRKNSEYFKGGIPWLKSGELNDSFIFKTEEQISQLALDNSNTKIFPKNTILMAMYGATIGKLGVLGIDSCTNQAICAFLVFVHVV